MTPFQFLQTALTERKVGRLNRWNYLLGMFLFSLAGGVLTVLIAVVGSVFVDLSSETVAQLVLVLTFPVSLLLAAGRLNDIGVNGWWALLLLGLLLSPFFEKSWLFQLYAWSELLLFVIPGQKTAPASPVSTSRPPETPTHSGW